MSEGAWKCQFENLPEKITVGDLLTLRCEGATLGFDPNGIQFQFDEKTSFSLVRLETNKWSSGDMELTVTSYRAESHQFGLVKVSDGQHTALAHVPPLHVTSVIDPSNPPKEPYGPFGPFSMSFPVTLWLTLALAVAALLGLIGFQIYRVRQRRLWLEEIRSTIGVHPPYHAFSKTLRLANREYTAKANEDPALRAREFVLKLQQAFRLFLAQELMVPAHRWTRRATLKRIRKDHPRFYRHEADAVDRLLQEFERALKPERKLTEIDCLQLFELSRLRAEHIWRILERKGRRK